MKRFKTILVINNENICTITLNRPDALNALNSELIKELVEALYDADQDKNVRVIIISLNLEFRLQKFD